MLIEVGYVTCTSLLLQCVPHFGKLAMFHLQQELSQALKTQPFHGGRHPDLADLDVYGVLQSIRGASVALAAYLVTFLALLK